MNIFMLLQRSKEHLEKGSPEFSDTADTILALLRSHEVIPYKRSTVNGELHKRREQRRVATHSTYPFRFDVGVKQRASLNCEGSYV